jgi:hypothetical protein
MSKLIQMRVTEIVIPTSRNPERARRGDMEALAADIKSHGMLTPILVSDDHVLLDGARRLALHEGDKVQVRVAETVDEVFQFLAEASHPLQEPWDLIRIFDLHQASLKMLERKRAARIKQNHYVRTGRKRTPEERRVARQMEPWRHRISRLTGAPVHDVQLAISAYTALAQIDDMPPKQQAALRDVIEALQGSKRGARAAYTKYVKVINELKLEESPEAVQTASQQRQLMNQSLPVLRGVARAFMNLTDINPKITNDELKAWQAEINAIKFGINRAHKKILERTQDN